jgi:DNA-binding transcriptional regulator YdaS (Cro superfamily)
MKKCPCCGTIFAHTSSPIKKACDVLGGRVNLATALDVTPQAVYLWVTKPGKITAERCVGIERATDGVVTRYELRPDLFGPAPAKIRRRTAPPSQEAAA